MRHRSRGRKAILFSLMTILLSTFFILLFWNSTAPRLDPNAPAVETRVQAINRQVEGWDAYVGDATRLSVRGALIELTTQLVGNTTPVTTTEISANISSCLRTGVTTYGGRSFYCFPNGINNSLSAKLDSFAALARKELNTNITYRFNDDPIVTDWAPFQLRVSFGIDYTVTDSNAPIFAKWNRSQRYDIIVSVEGLQDPLVARYQKYFVPAQNRTLTKYAVSRDLLNRSQFTDLITKRQYVENRGSAPTYLERLAGKVNGPFDTNGLAGIETILIPSETSVASNNYNRTSFTDAGVFSQTNLTCPLGTIHLNLTNMPAAYIPFSRLYLTPGTWARYNINGSHFNYTCG